MTRPKTAGQVATELADTQGGTVQEFDWGTDRERYVVSYSNDERAIVYLESAYGHVAVLVRHEVRDGNRWALLVTRVVKP